MWWGCRLWGVDFFQNDKILLFLHDLRAISLYEANGRAVLILALLLLLVVLLLLEGRLVCVFQR